MLELIILTILNTFFQKVMLIFQTKIRCRNIDVKLLLYPLWPAMYDGLFIHVAEL